MPDFIQATNLGLCPPCLCLCVWELGFRNRSVAMEHILTFLLKLKNEVGIFMAKRNHDLTNWFDHEDWLGQ